MRPLLALLVSVTILGGLQMYMMFRPQPVLREAEAEQTAEGRFSAEITLTFDAGPDAFAIDPSNAPSLLVQLRGSELIRRTSQISAGEKITIDPLKGLVTGGNEFFVQATPQDSALPLARAVRVRILRDGNPLAEESLWSEPGDVVQGAVLVAIPAWSGASDASPQVGDEPEQNDE